MTLVRILALSLILLSPSLIAQQSATLKLSSVVTSVEVTHNSIIETSRMEITTLQSIQKSNKPADIKVCPLFGEVTKSECQKAIDKDFLEMCDKNFKTRDEASSFFSARAWEYLAEGEKDTATYRFNLAWLLDSTQTDSYWGLGVIEYQKEHYPAAIKLMQTGLAMSETDNITLMVDLATVYIKCFTIDQNPEDMAKSFDLLDKAIAIQPQYANAYMQMALAKLINGKIDDAWINFHKGYELDPESASPDILHELLSQKDDPEQLFRKQ